MENMFVNYDHGSLIQVVTHSYLTSNAIASAFANQTQLLDSIHLSHACLNDWHKFIR